MPTFMTSQRSSLILFLDDSGHPAPSHSSGAIVIGGCAVASEAVPVLSRRITGAKGRLFPSRGHPASWEIKATDTIRPNPQRIRRNRELVQEILKIIGGLKCTAYTASIDKSRMLHHMSLKTTMPLLMQALVEHFAVECRSAAATGIIVMDRSSHSLDTHASHSVASYTSTKKLPMHPTVYYADSATSPAIQVADIITGVRRRAIEGDSAMQDLDNDLAGLRPTSLGRRRTHGGRLWRNRIVVL